MIEYNGKCPDLFKAHKKIAELQSEVKRLKERRFKWNSMEKYIDNIGGWSKFNSFWKLWKAAREEV